MWVYIGSSKSSNLPTAQAVTKRVMRRKKEEHGSGVSKFNREEYNWGEGATEDSGLRRRLVRNVLKRTELMQRADPLLMGHIIKRCIKGLSWTFCTITCHAGCTYFLSQFTICLWLLPWKMFWSFCSSFELKNNLLEEICLYWQAQSSYFLNLK